MYTPLPQTLEGITHAKMEEKRKVIEKKETLMNCEG